jgi:hypothetical protein
MCPEVVSASVARGEGTAQAERAARANSVDKRPGWADSGIIE